MAVRNRSTQIPYTNEVNTDGVATQLELNNAVNTHITTFHQGETASIVENNIEYYFDTANNRYLSKQLFMMDFSDNDSTCSNIYLFQKKNIRCTDSHNKLPFNKNILIDKIEVSLDSIVTGTVFDIEDENFNKLDDITIQGQEYTIFENLNIIIPSEVRIYVNSINTNKPVVKLWMRLIY